MDIYVKPDHDNAERIIAALTEFGFGSLDLSSSDFEKTDYEDCLTEELSV
jgi:hypothetical protein